MRVNHVNIVVSDMERSLAFYAGLLRMRVTFETELKGAWIDAVTGIGSVTARCVFCQPAGGGTRFEILEYSNPPGADPAENRAANTRGLRHVALEVDDLDAWYERLVGQGVVFLSPPVTVPFSIVDGVRKRLCYMHDPDGAVIELCDFVDAWRLTSRNAQPRAGWQAHSALRTSKAMSSVLSPLTQSMTAL